jgi:hypothetical protein
MFLSFPAMPAPSFLSFPSIPAFPVLAFAGLIPALGLMGCSSSFCGAPCEASQAKADAAKAAKAEKAARAAEAKKAKATRGAAAKDALPVLVNQYGSFYGHLEVDSLTATQLRVEKTSLEVMLSVDAKDKEILKVLKEGKLDTTTFDYNDYSTGGSRYTASGKLRRDAVTQDDQRRLPRMISESQHREVIERYRQLRRRMSRIRAAEAAVADSLAAANPPPAAVPAAFPADSSRSPAPGSLPAPRPDSVWTGRCRANGQALAVPETFKTREACESWGREQSGAFREKAYAFECECRTDGGIAKRKFW